MDNLRFGTTALRKARRRQRFRRVVLAAWAVSTICVLTGVPVARSTALNLLEQLTVGDDENGAQAASTAEVFSAQQPGPEPTETLGQDSEKKKLPDVVAQARKERRAADGSSAGLEAAYASGSITEIISAAATEFGIEPGYLISVAECESGLDPSAYNAAGYHGLFQYDDTTWSAYGYGSIWDPVAQARTTAELLAAGQSSRWPNCA